MKHLLLTLLLAAMLPARAVDVTISNAWARATVPGQAVGAAYFDIRAHGAAKLVKVTTPAAGTAEVHEMTMDKGVMRMRPVGSLSLPAGTTVSLHPNGYHVMLMDLKAPLKAGGKVPLSLTVEADGKQQQIDVTAEVRNP